MQCSGIVGIDWCGNFDRSFAGNASIHRFIQRANGSPGLVVLKAVQVAADFEPSVEVVERLVVVATLLVVDAKVEIESVDRRVK